MGTTQNLKIHMWEGDIATFEIHLPTDDAVTKVTVSMAVAGVSRTQYYDGKIEDRRFNVIEDYSPFQKAKLVTDERYRELTTLREKTSKDESSVSHSSLQGDLFVLPGFPKHSTTLIGNEGFIQQDSNYTSGDPSHDPCNVVGAQASTLWYFPEEIQTNNTLFFAENFFQPGTYAADGVLTYTTTPNISVLNNYSQPSVDDLFSYWENCYGCGDGWFRIVRPNNINLDTVEFTIYIFNAANDRQVRVTETNFVLEGAKYNPATRSVSVNYSRMHKTYLRYPGWPISEVDSRIPCGENPSSVTYWENIDVLHSKGLLSGKAFFVSTVGTSNVLRKAASVRKKFDKLRRDCTSTELGYSSAEFETQMRALDSITTSESIETAVEIVENLVSIVEILFILANKKALAERVAKELDERVDNVRNLNRLRTKLSHIDPDELNIYIQRHQEWANQEAEKLVKKLRKGKTDPKRIQQIRTWLSETLSETKSEFLKDPLGFVSGQYLQYIFAIAPLKTEARTLKKAISEVINNTETSEANDEVSDSLYWDGHVVERRTVTKLYLRPKAERLYQVTRLLDKFGASGTADLWNLFPLSFAIDWFIPVGNLLNMLDTMYLRFAEYDLLYRSYSESFILPLRVEEYFGGAAFGAVSYTYYQRNPTIHWRIPTNSDIEKVAWMGIERLFKLLPTIAALSISLSTDYRQALYNGLMQPNKSRIRRRRYWRNLK